MALCAGWAREASFSWFSAEDEQPSVAMAPQDQHCYVIQSSVSQPSTSARPSKRISPAES